MSTRLVTRARTGCPRYGASRGLRMVVQAGMVLFGASAWAGAETYPLMAKLEQYLMLDRASEIALARSAAPQAVSAQARVLVLGRKGYETAVEGTNDFTCLVERSWMCPFDHPEFWNPKIRAPVCFNAPATRSVLPVTIHRTQLALAGLSKEQMLAQLKAEQAQHPSTLEAGAMSYMMSRSQYLGDDGKQWIPHLMFHVAKAEAAAWGANVAGSPVMLDDDHVQIPEGQTTFMVPAGHWSDGTAAPAMDGH